MPSALGMGLVRYPSFFASGSIEPLAKRNETRANFAVFELQLPEKPCPKPNSLSPIAIAAHIS